MRARRRIRDRVRPGVAEPDLRGAAARGDDACRWPTTAERWSRARPTTVLERTERGRRAGARSGARARRRRRSSSPGRVAARAPLPLLLDADGLNAHAGRLAVAGAPARGDRDDPARRRAGAAAASQTAPRSAPGAWTASARAAAEARAIVVLKGDDTLVADPERPGRRQPRRRARAGHRRHRRRPLRRDRRLPEQGDGSVRRRVRRRAGARPRRPAAGSRDRPRGRHRRRRDPGAAAGSERRRSRARNTLSAMPLRAIARVNLAAIERNAARLRRVWPRAPGSARWSRPTATATARYRRPGRRWPAAPARWRSPPRTRPRSCARAGSRRRCW